MPHLPNFSRLTIFPTLAAWLFCAYFWFWDLQFHFPFSGNFQFLDMLFIIAGQTKVQNYTYRNMRKCKYIEFCFSPPCNPCSLLEYLKSGQNMGGEAYIAFLTVISWNRQFYKRDCDFWMGPCLLQKVHFLFSFVL